MTRSAGQNAQGSGAELQKPNITECDKCGRVIGTGRKRLEHVYAYGGEWLCLWCYRTASNRERRARTLSRRR